MPEPRPFQLSLDRTVEPFRREIEYVCAVIEDWYPIKRSPHAGPILHYGPRPSKGAIKVPAHLFPAGVSANEDGLRARLDRIEGMARKLLPARTGGGSVRDLGYDAIGLVFLMLSRIEERGAPCTDRYGRFPHSSSFAARCGHGCQTLGDIAAEDLARAIFGENHPPPRTQYRVLLTHDVDQLRGYHRWHLPLRYALGDIVRRGRPLGALDRLRGSYFTGEPFASMRGLMDLAERHSLSSRFYFMGPSRNPMDSPYALTMRGTLRRIAAEIRARGHIIGFHPGFGTPRDADEWLQQKRGLEAVIDAPALEGRQHVLGYDAGETPDIWEAAGMELDTSLAFPEVTGFRAGTCRPFPAYSLRKRCTLNLRHLCTAIMDFGLFGGRYRELSPPAALGEARRAADACKRFGGTLVILYHSGQVADRPLARFFEDLLDEVA